MFFGDQCHLMMKYHLCMFVECRCHVSVRSSFKSKPNCIHILMLLHLTAWMMKQIIFLATWKDDVVKADLSHLLNVHQQMRPKSPTPWLLFLSTDYSLRTEWEGKLSSLSWGGLYPLHLSVQIAALFTRVSSELISALVRKTCKWCWEGWRVLWVFGPLFKSRIRLGKSSFNKICSK